MRDAEMCRKRIIGAAAGDGEVFEKGAMIGWAGMMSDEEMSWIVQYMDAIVQQPAPPPAGATP